MRGAVIAVKEGLWPRQAEPLALEQLQHTATASRHRWHRAAPLLCVLLPLLLLATQLRPEVGPSSLHVVHPPLPPQPLLQQAPPERECSIDTAGSPWASHCVRLTDVCVDQGTLILHGQEFQQVGMKNASRLPSLDAPGPFGLGIKYRFPWVVGGVARGSEVEAQLRTAASKQGRRLLYEYQDPTDDSRLLPQLLMRPASSAEPRPYLAHPSFSSCTVPVVWKPHWQSNLHHLFRDTGATLYPAANATPWRQHLKFVMVTPDGLALGDTLRTVVGALTNLSVESWADFSSRLPPGAGTASGQAAASGVGKGGAQRQPSYEGSEQRCFRQLFVCGNATVGLPPTEYALGQLIVQHLQAGGAVPAHPPRCGLACQLRGGADSSGRLESSRSAAGKGDGSVSGGGSSDDAKLAASTHSGSVGPGSPASVTLQLVFHKRSNQGRQLLDVHELIKRCRRWKYRPAGSAVTFRVKCSEVEFKDLVGAVAAAQQADIFVGLHGANLKNSYFLPPGSNVVEVLPFEYEQVFHYWAATLATDNAQDETSQLLWWQILTCDPELSKPGPVEELGLHDILGDGNNNYSRNRSVRLTWEALEAVLQRIVETRGDVAQHRSETLGESQGHRLFMTAGKVVPGRQGLTCAAVLDSD